jgi:ATP-dependent helicase/DNAse subunit B
MRRSAQLMRGAVGPLRHHGAVGLTLVTGPANSAKAHVVLERHRAALARGAILVVPRAADVEYYRRELAAAGSVLGVRVESFGGLLREIARRSGMSASPIGVHARERLLAATLSRSELHSLAGAAQAPGFVGVLAGFVAELEARRVTPARLISALRAWAPDETARGRYAQELASVYGGYRHALERLGRLDEELRWAAALDALRLALDRWGRTPVFCYGFDDLDPIQLDAIETLADRVGAPVTISLPGEPGRVALAGRAATLETLRPLAEEVIELPALADYYEPPAREALHHLERSLFEDAPGEGDAGDAVALLEGGDERAEAELVAAEIARLLGEGCAPGEIAVLTRGASAVGALMPALLDLFGVAHTAARRERFADTALGGGLLALIRAALLDGGAGDLVRWLRVDGLVERREFVDRFEQRLAADGITDLALARERWQEAHWPLDALDRLAGAAREGGLALLDRVERELESIFAAPWRREAALLDPWQAAVRRCGVRALHELRELARADRSLAPGPADVLAALERVNVELAPAAEADAVLICDALALRARRVRALFIVGLQEGAFPAAAREQPFLSSAERSELAQASGLVLGEVAEPLDAERYLFYALCSRPTRWLRVSWHDATDDGEPALRSLFVDDLADCFGERLLARRQVRGAGTLRWEEPPAAAARLQAILRAPRRTAPLIAPLADPGALLALRGHETHSPSALESWTSCPVKWLLERALKPREMEPDSMYLARGRVAHDVLAAVFGGLRERTGSARIDAASLPLALELLDAALAAAVATLSPDGSVDRTERNRQRHDLIRYLEFVAERPGPFEPREFELAFGMAVDDWPAAVLGDGALALCGRIDRLDVDPDGGALVYDYKGGAGSYAAAKWPEQGLLQQALYMLATEQLLGLRALGGLYQPLRAGDLRPRGAVLADVDAGVALYENDRLSEADLRALVEGQLRAAVRAAAELDAGALEPRPATCSYEGGCSHPSICRVQSR